MESSSQFKEWMSSISGFLEDKVWFQELKTKWEELDPQSRSYLKFAFFGLGLFLLFFIIMSSIWSVHSLRKELSEKRTLLQVIHSANDEAHRLKESLPSSILEGGENRDMPWPSYFESVASNAGIDKSSLSVTGEKSGSASDQAKEMLFDVSLKHLNIKQVVRYAFALENGQKPIKLRNLTIDTKNDLTGYLDATLAVSAFTSVVPK